MNEQIEKLRAYLEANGGTVDYADFVAQIDVQNRRAVVDAARKVFKFSLAHDGQNTVHTVSIRQ